MKPHLNGRLSRPTTRILLATALIAVPASFVAIGAASGTEAPPAPAYSAERAPNAKAVKGAEAPKAGQEAEDGLDDPAKKEIAMQLVSSAENSSLDWKAQYGYIEDIDDGRGYTGGIIGFCSGTHDMLELVEEYTARKPGNRLARYLPALRDVDGSDSHDGLDPGFTSAWKKAARDPVFQETQNDERDRVYFDPAVSRAKDDGLRTLGQFAYYDAIVMHGESGFEDIRDQALSEAESPAQGGDETDFLNAFLDARVEEMQKEEAHEDTSRVDTAQRVFLDDGNLDLDPPLTWQVYGEEFHIG